MSLRGIVAAVEGALVKEVPATGLALFRIAFGLVMLQEIAFLIYFSPLIFDAVPYLDRASPVIPLLLVLWGIAAIHLTVGRYTRIAASCNYLFWVFFVVLTPMWQDFDGGFDHLMIGSSLLLILLPSERAFSFDQLRWKLKDSTTARRFAPRRKVPVLSYYIPVGVSIGLLYFDSAVHKLFSEFWRNGLGAWLPASMPYYMSPLDLTWLLNREMLQKCIGYGILGFELVFLLLFCSRTFRVPFLVLGLAFHTSIILSFNIYPFGFAMLAHYLLMVPFGWWGAMQGRLQRQGPRLTVFYDEDCPLCNRTVITLEHFDCFKALAFRALQTHARDYRALDAIPQHELLRDLYALDANGRLYAGFDTYLQVFLAMRYTGPLGLLMKVPGIHALGRHAYRRIADRRARTTCDASCLPAGEVGGPQHEILGRLFYRAPVNPAKDAQRITKLLLLLLLLQLNCTIHYGVLNRLEWEIGGRVAETAGRLSDVLVLVSTAFLGIAPHWLYVHDHFDGYNHIFAFTYSAPDGQEKWLPFVNGQGRLIAPNWGRVQSMWANVAVRGTIEPRRFYKLSTKVTAFWGTKVGLDLNDAEISIKMKEVEVPTRWEPDLRELNLGGDWRDIGRVAWTRQVARIEIPAIDLGTL